MTEKIVPFSDLAPDERLRMTRVNWVVVNQDGSENPDWLRLKDRADYGNFPHIAVINQETGVIFDKVDLQWQKAVFVVVFRRNRSRIEYLLPNERRRLLKDELGEQGNVFIRNIPQGLIEKDETPEQAALREVKEETGLELINLQPLGELFFDAANSQTAMPFFLAEVESQGLKYNQSTEPTEQIEVGEGNWFAIEDIPHLRLQCAKTLAGLMLATGFLGIWPSQE